ncbi:hypothetical protein QNH20_16530 [Neobacillus sp. WH10]|uniref:hypothetical protein n=1 Tax=Neobacillus sp. WH10 TaxID=3047873 RepID=UPI0024C0EB84|nr:hypothetical protein [Neobacillus sp. WH10]WHY75724.1 hypothetical protein QNH20_16530 [Neobacillus sp. WH10]
MHPKKIVDDFQLMGASLVLDGDDLYIDNPDNIYPELEELAKHYKSRIVTYLKGGYSDKDHNVKQTIDKVLLFMSGVQQDMNPKIEDWLNNDPKALAGVMQLIIDLSHNGWDDCKKPNANYETPETEKISEEIYERAMSYFKRGVTKSG